jgi:hypothetical protein
LNNTVVLLMLQCPPCHLVFAEKDSKIDVAINKVFTRKGTHVNYTVWPVLCLFEGGPILNKGVVQPHAS